MAFHLHLINGLQVFSPAAAPFRQKLSRHRPLGLQPALHWELAENGQLHACWTQD